MDGRIHYRISYFRDMKELWNGLSDELDKTYSGLQDRAPLPGYMPETSRLAGGLGTLTTSINTAMRAYIGALKDGVQDCTRFAEALDSAARAYIDSQDAQLAEIDQLKKELEA